MAALALIGGAMLCGAQDKAPAKPEGKSAKKTAKAEAADDGEYVNRKMAETWKNPDQTLRRLGGTITGRVKGTDPDDVQQFV